jgi:serine/threonine protein kinase
MKDPQELPFHEKYAFQRVIGEGAFSQVRSAQHLLEHREYAVKILDLRDKNKIAAEAGDASGSHPSVEKVLREFQIEKRIWIRLSEHDHPNLVKLHEAFQDHSFGYLVMEICNNSLLVALRAEATLDEHVLVRYFKDMLSGLQRLHQLNVVHRDVKQDNFLIGGPDGRTVKLCDFGLSAVLPMEGGKVVGVYGTAPYMPPEMLQPKGSHGLAADIWSYGVIVYTHFFGGFPYSPEKKTAAAMKECIRKNEQAPTYQTAKRLKYNGQVSGAAVAFVKALLNREADERPKAEEAMQFDYLRNARQLAAEAARADPSPPSLVPMLHGAVRSGAFGTRPPQANPSLDNALMDLQKSNRGLFKVHHHSGLHDDSESNCSSKSTGTSNHSKGAGAGFKAPSRSNSESTMSGSSYPRVGSHGASSIATSSMYQFGDASP